MIPIGRHMSVRQDEFSDTKLKFIYQVIPTRISKFFHKDHLNASYSKEMPTSDEIKRKVKLEIIKP